MANGRMACTAAKTSVAIVSVSRTMEPLGHVRRRSPGANRASGTSVSAAATGSSNSARSGRTSSAVPGATATVMRVIPARRGSTIRSSAKTSAGPCWAPRDGNIAASTASIDCAASPAITACCAMISICNPPNASANAVSAAVRRCWSDCAQSARADAVAVAHASATAWSRSATVNTGGGGSGTGSGSSKSSAYRMPYASLTPPSPRRPGRSGRYHRRRPGLWPGSRYRLAHHPRRAASLAPAPRYPRAASCPRAR